MSVEDPKNPNQTAEYAAVSETQVFAENLSREHFETLAAQDPDTVTEAESTMVSPAETQETLAMQQQEISDEISRTLGPNPEVTKELEGFISGLPTPESSDQVGAFEVPPEALGETGTFEIPEILEETQLSPNSTMFGEGVANYQDLLPPADSTTVSERGSSQPDQSSILKKMGDEFNKKRTPEEKFDDAVIIEPGGLGPEMNTVLSKFREQSQFGDYGPEKQRIIFSRLGEVNLGTQVALRPNRQEAITGHVPVDELPGGNEYKVPESSRQVIKHVELNEKPNETSQPGNSAEIWAAENAAFLQAFDEKTADISNDVKEYYWGNNMARVLYKNRDGEQQVQIYKALHFLDQLTRNTHIKIDDVIYKIDLSKLNKTDSGIIDISLEGSKKGGFFNLKTQKVTKDVSIQTIREPGTALVQFNVPDGYEFIRK